MKLFLNLLVWMEKSSNREEKRRKFMQSEPTVNQLKAVDLSIVAHEWPSIAESLGVSSVAIKEVNSSIGSASTSCRIMLVKWLNHEKGTGNKERTWNAIETAIRRSGLYSEAYQFIEKAMRTKHMQERKYAEIFRRTPTLQEVEKLILHYLGEDWHRVGELLGMSPKVMKEIGSKFGSVPTQCSEAMFSKWLNHEEGTGHKERTWGTVLTALEDAGRGDVAIAVLDELIVKHEEESLRAAPNIDDIQVLVIPHVLLMWHVLGLQLGIHKAILSAIESDARRNRSILSKQAIEMFQLWLDGAEGTGDQHRSWSTILRALIKSGLSEVSIEVLKHFDPTATPKDIGQALSQLQSSSDDISTISSDPGPMTSTSVPTTSQGHCSKSLSESSGSEVYTDPLPRLGSKRSCSEGSMGGSSHATVEVRTSIRHSPHSNGDHFTRSEPKRRRLEEGLDKRGKFPSNQPARFRRRQKLKKLNGHSNKSD